MANMIILILDELGALPTILTRWREVGVSGTTILRSVGGYSAETWLAKVGRGVFGRVFDEEEIEQRTLISVIDDDEILERAIAEAEEVVGDFDRPRGALLFVLPVSRTLGMKKRREPTVEQGVDATVQTLENGFDLYKTTVEQVLPITNIMPALVRPETPLTDVVVAVAQHPGAHVACVVNEEDRLVGIVRLEEIMNDLFVELMPEEVLVQTTELEHALQYADHLKHCTAGDSMETPVSVHPKDSVRDALKKVHDHHLPGIPVVNETNHVVGYVSVMEMLALFGSGKSLCWV